MSSKQVKQTMLIECISEKNHTLDEKESFSVGKSEEADIPLLVVNSPRKQFAIEKISEGFFLVPQFTSTPTFCNGQPASGKTVLKSGLAIRAGSYHFFYVASYSENSGKACGCALKYRLTIYNFFDLKLSNENVQTRTIFFLQGGIISYDLWIAKPVPKVDSLFLKRYSAKVLLLQYRERK